MIYTNCLKCNNMTFVMTDYICETCKQEEAMRVCHACGATYLDSISVCPKCDTPYISEEVIDGH